MANLRTWLQEWDSQPQGPAEIDWSNPITSGLDYACVDGVDLVAHARFGASVGVGRLGRTQRGVAPYKATADVADCTIIAHHRYSSDNGDYSGVVFGYYTNASNSAQLGIGFGNIGGSSTADVYAVNRSNGSGVTTLIADQTSVDAVLAIRGTMGSATAAQWFLNGAKQGTTIARAGSAGYSANTNKKFEVMLATSTGKESAFAYKFGRLLTDNEVLSLSQNPWQIFARRIFIPIAAASATTYTLSAATYVPGSITASSVTARVTVTEA